LEVLKGVDLEVPRGMLLAIVGASGSGKSTLLNVLGTLDRPDRGTVELAGLRLEGLDETQRCLLRARQLGFVFQFHHLLPEFTAEENVAFPHRIAGLPAAEARRRAEDLLDRVGLRERRDHRPRALSGGEQQRVAFARALARGPGLLLADEPTGNLDADSAGSVFGLLEELHRERGMTTILVTHNPDLASRCDTISLMSREGIAPAPGSSGGYRTDP
jgi:lipoprotein-releasing system ATP-binding protein